mmetsp:Transcript_13886/g.35547  ORF Transcript_13886/g.35547 Transcript_13886/m.35547 type:complete len:232 (-) Transcript_13886:460-1155(-)
MMQSSPSSIFQDDGVPSAMLSNQPFVEPFRGVFLVKDNRMPILLKVDNEAGVAVGLGVCQAVVEAGVRVLVVVPSRAHVKVAKQLVGRGLRLAADDHRVGRGFPRQRTAKVEAGGLVEALAAVRAEHEATVSFLPRHLQVEVDVTVRRGLDVAARIVVAYPDLFPGLDQALVLPELQRRRRGLHGPQGRQVVRRAAVRRRHDLLDVKADGFGVKGFGSLQLREAVVRVDQL